MLRYAPFFLLLAHCTGPSSASTSSSSSSGGSSAGSSGTSAAEWTLTKGSDPHLDVLSLAVQGTSLFIGVSEGAALLRSTDAGATYTTVGANVSANGLSVSSMAVNATSIFAASDDVYSSVDGGDNWLPLHVVASPTNVVFVSAIDTSLFAGILENGLFASAASPVSWTQASLTLTGVVSMAKKDGLLFAGAQLIGPSLSVSSDGGANWTESDSGIPAQGVSGLPTTVYAIVVSGNNLVAGTSSGIYVSSDDGASWVAKSTGLNINGMAIVTLLAVDTRIFAGAGDNIYVSSDGGSSWKIDSSGLPDEFIAHGLSVMGTRLYAGGYSQGVWSRAL